MVGRADGVARRGCRADHRCPSRRAVRADPARRSRRCLRRGAPRRGRRARPRGAPRGGGAPAVAALRRAAVGSAGPTTCGRCCRGTCGGGAVAARCPSTVDRRARGKPAARHAGRRARPRRTVRRRGSSMTEQPGLRTIQSVDRAAALLKAVANSRQPVTVVELAAQCGLNRSTAWRLLATLASQGLVDRDPVTQRYSVGYAIFQLAAAGDHDAFVRRAHPVLEQLANDTGETVNLAVAKRLNLVYGLQV